MPIDESKLKNQAKSKDREIQELKELLAEAESEIKELNDFHGFQKPKSSILESAFLNKVIKYSFFAVLCVFIILVALYPWLNKDKFAGDQPDEEITQEEDLTIDSETKGVEEEQEEITEPEPKKEEPKVEKDIFEPTNMLIIDSDLGWLNVRTEPDIKTGDIIKKINSNDEYEWLEKTDNNWYKIKIDSKGNTGYISGEYAELK